MSGAAVEPLTPFGSALAGALGAVFSNACVVGPVPLCGLPSSATSH